MDREECRVLEFLRSDFEVAFPLSMNGVVKGCSISERCLISSPFTGEFGESVEKPAFASFVVRRNVSYRPE